MGARQQPTAFCAAGWGGRGVGGGRLLGRWPGIIWPALSGGLRGSDGDDAAGVELLQLPQQDGLTLARRFRDHDGMILRFATNLAVGFTSNQADYAEFGVMRTRRWMPWHAGEAGRARPA